MNKRKLLTVILALALVAAGTCPVYANNHADISFTRQYISTTNWAQTGYADKYDKISHYVYNKCSMQVRVVSYSQTGANCTNNLYAVIPSNSERFIYNSVWESGFRNCRLSIRSEISGASGYLKGYWSPDSIGSCPVANP